METIEDEIEVSIASVRGRNKQMGRMYIYFSGQDTIASELTLKIVVCLVD